MSVKTAITACAATCVIVAALIAPAAARAEVPVKAPIAPGASPLSDPGRYKVTRGFDDLVEHYKRQFKNESGVRWYNIINQPGLRAKHLASLRKNTEWEGINIYERGSEVRMYVVPRVKHAGSSKPSKAPATKRKG